MDLKQLNEDYDKSEADLTALQSVGQIVAEVLRKLDDERCTCAAILLPSPFRVARDEKLT